MHIETSADARRSKRHGAGADDRGYLASAASRLSSWWSGASRPQGLTADTASGAGLQARNDGDDSPPNGYAIPAPPAGGSHELDPDPRAVPVDAYEKAPIKRVPVLHSRFFDAGPLNGHDQFHDDSHQDQQGAAEGKKVDIDRLH